MKPFLISAAFLLAWTLSLSAMQVKFLAWDHEIASRKISIKSGESAQEIEGLTPYKRTADFSIGSSSDALQLVTQDRFDSNGKPFLLDLKLNTAFESPLIILFPDEKAPSGLRTVIIDDNTTSFAWGSTRIVNTTSQEFVFRHENKAFPLKASWEPVNISSSGNTRNLEVQLYSRNAPRTLYYSSIWEYNPEIRMLAIIVPGSQSNTGKISFKLIPESRRSALVALSE